LKDDISCTSEAFTYRSDQGRRAGNLFLLETAKSINPGILKLVASCDEDTRHFATLRATQCSRLAAIRPDSAYRLLSRLVQSFGIAPPVIGEHISEDGAIARMRDELWWRRALRKAHGRDLERFAIGLGLVHKFAGVYVSDETVQRRRERKFRNRRLLESLSAVNELDQEYSLQELAELGVANPRRRRGELMARIAVFELIAKDLSHAAEFYTLTCPSRMHARHAKSGGENQRYDGTSPRQAQAYLSKLWSQIRAKLDREDIRLYGFRICEPQHDGTPHWHLLLFMESGHVDRVRATLMAYALRVDGNEPGAQEHRFAAVPIDYTRGSAAGYIAKYVSKNIDGFGLEDYNNGHDAKSNSERVAAWASTWGIRQFQQIGGPPVTVWRELRRLPDAPEGILGDAVQAADKADWRTFVQLMGGATAKRADRPVKLAKVWRDERGQYGEPLGLRVIGVEAEGKTAVSRVHSWRVERRRTAPQALCGMTADPVGWAS